MFEIAFQMFDLNGDGEVSPAEFEKVINAIIATVVCLVAKPLNWSEAEGNQVPVVQKCNSVFPADISLSIGKVSRNAIELSSGQRFVQWSVLRAL